MISSDDYEYRPQAGKKCLLCGGLTAVDNYTWLASSKLNKWWRGVVIVRLRLGRLFALAGDKLIGAGE